MSKQIPYSEELSDLRSELYARYGRDFQSAGDRPDLLGATRWGRAYDWYLRAWLPANRDAPIADLGCGSGYLLFFFKQRGFTNLRGCDLSPDQCARARTIVDTVECTDAIEWLSQYHAEFELLTALDLIEHLTRKEALTFVERAHRALKPGGSLILQTPNAAAPLGMDYRYNDMTHEWCYNANQLERLLRRVGFQRVEFREQGPVPIGYSLVSTARWLLWKAMGAFVQLWWLAETGKRAAVLSKNMLVRSIKR